MFQCVVSQLGRTIADYYGDADEVLMGVEE